MKVANTIQCSTIANLLATELNRLYIPLIEDSDERDNLIYSSAEYILYNYNISTDINEAVNSIKKYIKDTLINYPNYFLTGKAE